MPTTEVKSIKPSGGGDYTSLNAWNTAEAADLVSSDKIKVAEVYSGGNSLTASLTLSVGWTTDKDHYVEVRAASGHEHAGVWNTSKSYAESSGVTIAFDSSLQFIRIRKMQIRTTAAATALRLQSDVTGRYIIDRCIIRGGNQCVRIRSGGDTAAGGYNIMKNCAVITRNAGQDAQGIRIEGGIGTPDTKIKIYNCTIITDTAGGAGITGIATHNIVEELTTQNCYISSVTAYVNEGGFSTFNKGSNDATNTNEAFSASLRNILFNTSNFVSATTNSENVHLVVGSALLDVGTDLSGGSGEEAITEDYEGTIRPQGTAFDIGADEFPAVPICWNYTARYKGSNRLFKVSGCGPFPRKLRVPSNIDLSTGKMIDDGQLIDSNEYEAI